MFSRAGRNINPHVISAFKASTCVLAIIRGKQNLQTLKQFDWIKHDFEIGYANGFVFRELPANHVST
jgi:hypothetical protein